MRQNKFQIINYYKDFKIYYFNAKELCARPKSKSIYYAVLLRYPM